MTLEEKIQRIRMIPKKIVDLEISKELRASVHAVQYENAGNGKSSRKNSTESAMQDVVSIGEEIEDLLAEQKRLIAQVCDEIDQTICGEGLVSIDMRVILKEHLLKGTPLKRIASDIVHREYKTTRYLYRNGCEKLKISHSIPLNPTQSHLNY